MKQQIKSHMKHLPRGKRFGVADDFLKEVDEIRKELYSVLKQAQRDHKMALFNVEKLIFFFFFFESRSLLKIQDTRTLYITI